MISFHQINVETTDSVPCSAVRSQEGVCVVPSSLAKHQILASPWTSVNEKGCRGRLAWRRKPSVPCFQLQTLQDTECKGRGHGREYQWYMAPSCASSRDRPISHRMSLTYFVATTLDHLLQLLRGDFFHLCWKATKLQNQNGQLNIILWIYFNFMPLRVFVMGTMCWVKISYLSGQFDGAVVYAN